jgi:hypothetical protein
MIRREILEETGGYNEDFRMSQDYELWLRIAKTHRIANLPEPLYGVRRHGNRVTLTRMFQAGLYRILAVNLSRGEVPQAVMEQIRRDGIETYYEHLNRRDRLKYSTAATAKCIKNKRYDDAENHLRKIIGTAPLRLKARLQLVYVRMKKKQAAASPR